MTLRHRGNVSQYLHPLLMITAMMTGTAIAAEELDEITVTAARAGHEAIDKTVVGRSSSTGAPIEHLTLTWSVAYTDLDLGTQSGANVLEKRIHTRAEAVCRELDRLLPLVPDDRASCVKGAVEGAMSQAHRVIAAAGAKRAASASE